MSSKITYDIERQEKHGWRKTCFTRQPTLEKASKALDKYASMVVSPEPVELRLVEVIETVVYRHVEPANALHRPAKERVH